jgi:hypothetical protein
MSTPEYGLVGSKQIIGGIGPLAEVTALVMRFQEIACGVVTARSSLDGPAFLYVPPRSAYVSHCSTWHHD